MHPMFFTVMHSITPTRSRATSFLLATALGIASFASPLTATATAQHPSRSAPSIQDRRAVHNAAARR